ncbi:ABC transporter ATP-binding protein [Pseudonocardia acaciae]|uniref:ABC transporter ATP-binding protein n=1 Tax=Pseudonocardia acaciae TaxID=551276 RepID=UPI000684E9C7|nr:ABC transporter ATP-binding protein [Pseudonocardia acaciae]
MTDSAEGSAEASAYPLAGPREVRAWLWTVATTNRAAFAAMLTLFGLATGAGLVGPWVLGELVESVRRGAATTAVDLLALLFVGVLLVQAALRAWARFVAAVFGERLLAKAREDLVHHAVELPLDTVETAGTGELLGRATSDVDKLDEGLRQAAPEIVIASVMVLLTAVAMVITSPLLALGALVSVPLLVVLTRWYRPRAVPVYERTLASWAKVHASAHETVVGGRTVEALGLGGRRRTHHDAAMRTAVAGERRSGQLWGVFLAGLDAAALLPIAVLLLFGAWAYQAGLVGIGEVTAMVLYAGALTEPINEVLGWMDELQIGHAALRRVLGVGKVPPDTGDPSVVPAGRRIELRGVRFGYRAGRDVLHGIDLAIEFGERIAVVGPSGAGKSTLGRLLAGINPPDRGEVLVGGVPISALPLERRRREVVLVTQEQHVFTGTLRDNLTLPRSASDEELHDALRAAGASDWALRLPDGLDTRLGSEGVPVPPAIVQQLALARLVLADPHTLVLDEATSMVDPTVSRGLERSLAAVLDGRTVVAIAHQLHAARDADRVIVMDEGRIVEQGPHDELMAAGGPYAELYNTWDAGTDTVTLR